MWRWAEGGLEAVAEDVEVGRGGLEAVAEDVEVG